MSNTYTQLKEPFAQGMEKFINKGGASLVYIPVSEVINRLNMVLGVENWSYTAEWQQLGTSIIADVTLTAFIEGKTVSRDGVGGQKIKLNKNQEPLDIGDEVKGAISDALKKAAQTLGVGLYLARSDEAIETEQLIDATTEIESAPKIITPWDSFMSISKSLSKEQKEGLRSSWDAHSNGKPTPKKETATPEDIEFLTVEATRLSFGGHYVETATK